MTINFDASHSTNVFILNLNLSLTYKSNLSVKRVKYSSYIGTTWTTILSTWKRTSLFSMTSFLSFVRRFCTDSVPILNRYCIHNVNVLFLFNWPMCMYLLTVHVIYNNIALKNNILWILISSKYYKDLHHASYN